LIGSQSHFHELQGRRRKRPCQARPDTPLLTTPSRAQPSPARSL
jgi:hypothetical protein